MIMSLFFYWPLTRRFYPLLDVSHALKLIKYTQSPFERVGVQRLPTNVSLTSVRWSMKMLTRDKKDIHWEKATLLIYVLVWQMSLVFVAYYLSCLTKMQNLFEMLQNR